MLNIEQSLPQAYLFFEKANHIRFLFIHESIPAFPG